ncbi:Na+/H+ antiporter NhaA [Brevundimonas sp. SH203]|uniref:Na+/H+ antiporter NhaA n=1 Tax=Brevundimonas sp. SH203 TaxID=345167 RepID=UPI000B35D881|nr:Na+/H+ antiporter NhaA [Brevundimonas sp. SH203]
MARRLTLDFLRTEAASGAALALAAVAALIVANSPWAADYFGWLKSSHIIQIGPIRLEETISDWIKEGLMAVFFLGVGLEIKYEIVRGELSDPRRLATPVLAALGGMAGPAAVYLALSGLIGAPHAGWPVPLATDIAFALAVFGLVGRGLPPSLRVFLLTLAIVDDLGAIVLIALLFSEGTHWLPLLGAAAVLIAGAVVARRVRIPAPVWILGFAVVWYLTIRSGLSTSLTAVAFALIVPIPPRVEGGHSPLKAAIHALHPWTAFLVLPLFAFAKAGVSFAGLTLEQAFAPLVVAIALGLFLGKQVGVFGAAWLASALKIGARPSGAGWLQVYGVSLLCGVGFTMSLFIGVLAFPGAVDSPEQVEVKLGVIGGSILSAIAAAGVLGLAGRARRPDPAVLKPGVEPPGPKTGQNMT